MVETGFAVIGMGKLGGHELNYSSDVDLIYVYESSRRRNPSRQSSGRRRNATARCGVGMSMRGVF